MSGYENYAKNTMINKKFGRLTVLELHGKNKYGSYEWKCQCECGTISIVTTNSLNSNNTRSCGCLLKETTVKTHSTHGLSDNIIYAVYQAMKSRCYNPNDKGYRNYGGRGIFICDEWKYDFQKFYDWTVSNGYQIGLSIERNDNDGPYAPWNCRWATTQEQNRNKRNIKLNIDSVKEIRESNLSNKILSEKYNVDRHTIYSIRVGSTWKDIDIR